MLNRLFKLKENNTNVKTEVTAGITTFMTMAYILAVNPSILGDAGMNPTAVLLATCLASFIGTACMALMANMPFALSAGMYCIHKLFIHLFQFSANIMDKFC